MIEGLAKMTSSEEIEQSLNMLLTAYEKKQIINRAVATSLLRQGKSYKEIEEMLWLSPITISAIRKSIKTQKEYVSGYMRSKKHEKKQKPLTKEELGQLRFSSWIDAFFTLPAPPLPHPRLNRLLGIDKNFSWK